MAIRIERESETVNGFVYSLHTDGGGPLSSREFVSVRPKEYSEDDWSVTRWFYFDEQSDHYERNFGQKVCTNEEYRRKCIEGTADWAVVSDIFEPLERELYESLYITDDMDKNEFREMLKEIFEHIKIEVRENGRTDLNMNEVLSDISVALVSEKI